MKTMVRFSGILLIAALVLVIGSGSTMLASTKTWVGGNGANGVKWSRAANWDPSGVPGAGDDVIINSSAAANCNIDVTTANLGSFTQSGGTVTFDPSLSLNVSGNFTLSGGTFTATGGTVVFIGGDASYSNSTANTLNSVTLNKDSAKTLTLASDMSIAGHLELTGGYISTGSNLVDIQSNGLGSVGATKGIVNGRMRRGFLSGQASGTYIFNDAATYITANGANPSSVEVQSFPNTSPTYGGSPGVNAVKRYYTITATGGSGFRTLSLSYRNAASGTDVDERNSLTEGLLTLWKGDGSVWIDEGGLQASVTNPSGSGAVSGSVSSFSDWTLAETGSPLPIQLASSAANVIRSNDVEVAWKTVSETNNYGFEIYRMRGETGDWTKIGFVQGHGTTLAPQSYSYIDQSLSFGKYSYRIKQIDLDGQSKEYPAMEVTVGAADKFVLAQNYPNPFNPSTMVEFAVPQSGFATMKVYNVLGQEVATLFEGNADAGKVYTARFNASSLPSGLYFYTLKSAGKSDTKRMLLLK